MKRFYFLASVLLVLAAVVVVWMVVHRRSVPETPRAVVTIPEGWTVEEINLYLKDKGVLVDGELGEDLEGYLFPDTYEFFLDSTTEVIKQKFRDNFLTTLREMGLDMSDEHLRRVITMASLLEWEVRGFEEKQIVSGILWKRLENGIPLQVDSTICYTKGTEPCLPISASDKKIDSRYNTYLYSGLPPGPISNPGADSIRAAARPVESPYWYYLSSDGDGRTVFASTLDEHRQNIIKYLGE